MKPCDGEGYTIITGPMATLRTFRWVTHVEWNINIVRDKCMWFHWLRMGSKGGLAVMSRYNTSGSKKTWLLENLTNQLPRNISRKRFPIVWLPTLVIQVLLQKLSMSGWSISNGTRRYSMNLFTRTHNYSLYRGNSNNLIYPHLFLQDPLQRFPSTYNQTLQITLPFST